MSAILSAAPRLVGQSTAQTPRRAVSGYGRDIYNSAFNASSTHRPFQILEPTAVNSLINFTTLAGSVTHRTVIAPTASIAPQPLSSASTRSKPRAYIRHPHHRHQKGQAGLSKIRASLYLLNHHHSYSSSAAATAAATMVAEDFDAVLQGKYPGKSHAKRVVDLIRKKDPNAHGVLYLEGRMTKLLEDNDSPEPFRQRRYFYYLTGCNLADCYFAYDIQASKSILFIPPIDPEDVIWSGLPTTIDDALKLYDVDEVKLTTEVNATLAHLAKANSKSTIFAINGQVSDHITFIEFENKDFALLKNAIEVSRVVKDEFEVAMIRKANDISGLAHKAVVERAKNASNERELEAAFLERCVANGAKEMAYHPIVASGTAAATLHYVPNDAPLHGKQNLLLDAGAEWNNYAADITRTFPLNGKFTKESREIYDIVFKMQKECIAIIKAGMHWEDAHVLAHKIAIDGLLSLGVLKGDKDELFKARISQAFFPHGLGHYLGMDTHDTGGNPNRQDPDVIFQNLRLRGPVPAGGVVTVEPGVYFCKFIIDPYLNNPEKSKYIDSSVLEKYWDVGGVRIEDNILVTETGYENLTTAIKEPGELEAVMAAS